MSALEMHLEEYLRLRRQLGHQLADQGRLLPRFVSYLEAKGMEHVSVQAVLDWSLEPKASPQSTVWSCRFMAARGFARYLSGIDPRTEVPPAGLISARRQWRQPFIYTGADVAALMAEAGRSIAQPLRAATYQTLIGLLACTGLRIGEALRLDRDDVDWEEGVLVVRRSKFNKSRLVPLAPSAFAALKDYACQRDSLCAHPASQSYLVSLRGTRVIYEVVCETHRMLCERSGVGAGLERAPRIHDFRHSFAVNTLLGWYREGVDVGVRLPWLSTYLGHREPRYTYHYLSATPELLGQAARLLERDQAVRP